MELIYSRSGYGYGSGSGSGSGDGDGYGCGDGYGYGYGYGSGSGYGCGDGYVIEIDFKYALSTFHYIKKEDDFYVMRSGGKVKLNEKLHEDEIELCSYGFHSSLSREDARRYKPSCSVLTKVLVWGKIIFDKDKLVSTDRMIIEEIKD